MNRKGISLGNLSGWVLLGAVTLLSGCGAASDDPASSGSTDETAPGQGSDGRGGDDGEEVELALNEGVYDKSAFGHAEPDLNDAHHPLFARETRLLRRDEVSVSWTGSTNGGFTLDDGHRDFAPLVASAAGALSGMTPFDVASANVDDDGHDELIAVGMVGGDLMVRVIDSNDEGLYIGHRDFKVEGSGYLHARLRAADVDDDGRAEIGVSAATADDVVVRIYDDAAGDFELVREVYSADEQEVAFAFGNFDDDRGVELALLVDSGDTLRLEVRDDLSENFAVLAELDAEELGFRDGDEVRGLRLEAANFVGGSRDEIVAFSDSSNQHGAGGVESICLENLAATDAPPVFTQVKGSRREFPESHPQVYRNTTDWGWHTLAADSNGDGHAEIFVLNRRPDESNFRWDVFHKPYGEAAAEWSPTSVSLLVEDDVNGTASAFFAKASGRTDGLGADVIVSSLNGDALTTQRITTATMEQEVDGRQETVFYPVIELLETRTIPENSRLWLAGGDYDADSLTIRFTGQKWLELARPRPIVLLAAAPAKEGISQNYIESVTGYGVSESSEQSNTQEYGVTHNVTLSLDVALPGADFLTAGAQASMSANFTQTNTQTSSTTYASSYSGAYPDDVIVFNGALFTRYEYEIMGGDPAFIGTLMTIDVPMAARVYKWTVDYYNESLPDEASPLDGGTISHVPGDPASYPTPAETAALSPLWQTPKSQVMTVGQGRSSSSIEIEVSQQSTSGGSRTLSTAFTGSVGCFVTAAYSQAWDETEAYSVTVGESTTYAGTVGDIEDRDDYTNWHYSYGLFVYPATLAGGEKLHVVQYWTEDLADGYRE